MEHCAGIVEVMGSTPVKTWFFFSGSVFTVHNTQIFSAQGLVLEILNKGLGVSDFTIRYP